MRAAERGPRHDPDDRFRHRHRHPARQVAAGFQPVHPGRLLHLSLIHIYTDRFKAAVSQRSIADWRDMWYTTDFTLFTPTWFRGAPWEQEADFKARSPITYVRNIHTPLMLIEGEADLRTPPGAGGEQMFRALKYLKRPVVMAVSYTHL